MSLGFSESINGAIWSQVGENGIEIRIPSSLPAGVRPRDLSVCIKDSCILVVSAGPTNIIQWRLYGPVEDETKEGGVEWMYEDEHLVIDLKKKFSGAEWTNLLDLPVRQDDPLLLSKDDLNKMVAQFFPPQIFSEDIPEASSVENEKKGKDEKDLDDLLDGAVKEVLTKENKEGESNLSNDDENENNLSSLAAYLRREREMMISSEKTLRERLAAVRAPKEKQEEEKEKVESTEEDTAKVATSREDSEDKKKEQMESKEKQEDAAHMTPILEKMLALSQEIRALRCKPSTIDSFIEVTRLSIDVAMANYETDVNEPFESEEEKQLTATQLMTIALSDSPLTDAQRLHFLRLGAIHHRHTQCIALMFGKYPNSPLGSYLMLRRALDDKDRSAEANHIVGDLFSSGSKYFVPMFPVAVYFYQRAAQLGYVAAMLSLAQLWSRGSTETSLLSDEEHEGLKNIDRYHKWIQKAVDRGSGASMFVQGCAYINGEYGLQRSYTEAKRLLDAAGKTGDQVSQLIRESNVLLKLEALRKEEEEEKKRGDSSNIDSFAPTTGSTSGRADSSTDNTAPKSDEALGKGSNASDSSSKTKISTIASSNSGMVVGASEARLDALRALERGSGAASGGSGNDAAKERTKRILKSGNAAAAARRMKFWERAGRIGITAYGLFTLAFPLRVITLPYIYEALGAVVKVVPWLGNPDALNF